MYDETGPPDRFHRTCLPGAFCTMAVLTIVSPNMSERAGFQRTVSKQVQEYLSAGKRPGGQMFAGILHARAYTRPNMSAETGPQMFGRLYGALG